MLLFVTIALGTIIFQQYYSSSFDPEYNGNVLDSIFAIIALMFAMEIFKYPYEGEVIIKLVYVIYPFLGMVLLGVGLLEFGMVVFTQRYRLRAWNEWMARTMDDHTILVGLGNVGTRIFQELLLRRIPTVVITLESDKHSETIEQILEDPQMSVIFGEATQISVLKDANVAKARALITVTNDDLVNFKIATKAKELNPDIRTIIRAFDRDFAQKVTKLFDVDAAISTSAIAAPAFVATSYEDGILQTLRSRKTGTDFHLFEIRLESDFDAVTVEFLEREYNVTILAIDNEAHPEFDDRIESGSKILLLGDLNTLRNIKSRYC